MATLSALLHFEGTDGASVFTDVSGKTWTAIEYNGAYPTTSTTSPIVGASSGALPAFTKISTPAHADFQFAGDLTIQGFFCPTTNSAWLLRNETLTTVGFWLKWDAVNFCLQFGFRDSGQVKHSVESSVSLEIGTPYWVQVHRSGDVLSLTIDDIVQSTLAGVGSYPIGNATALYFQGSDGLRVDELRIIKDAAVDVSRSQALAGLSESLVPLLEATLSVSVEVWQSASAALSVDVSVVPGEILSGAASVACADGEAAVWQPVVMLDGVDVTDRCIGEIRVEAEEGAARIAELSIRPATGTTLYLQEWTGRALSIDIADMTAGVPRYAMRLFTGVIDTPSVNLADRTVAVSATDDLQGRCNVMTQAQLSALIGGYYSAAVFDESADGWTYAQDRMSTLCASLDVSPLGALRVTPWTAKATPDLALGGLIQDGSLAVSLAERSALVNEITVSFNYRFPRVHAEGHPLSYTYVDMTGFAQYILDGKWWLQRESVVSAIESAGGTIESITYVPLPDEIIAVGSGYFTPSAADQDLCLGFNALVSYDYAATVEEAHSIRVYDAHSIATMGLRAGTMSGALDAVSEDVTAIEDGIRLFKADVISNPPRDQATVVSGETTGKDVTLTSATNRAAANAAMETLIAVAKAKIQASHRQTTVSATVPLNPAIDLDKTISIVTGGVTAVGKVRSVTHRMNTDSGSATSEVSMAISVAAGVGIVHDETTTSAPAGTTATASDLSGSPTVVFNNGATQDHTITITFPAVEDARRNGSAIELASAYSAAIAEDVFSITL